MHSLRKKLSLSFLAVFVAVTASVSARDITINDGRNGSSAWYGGAGNPDTVGHQTPPTGGPASLSPVREDQEVETGMQTGQQWDLEGIGIDGSTLKLVGGYSLTGPTSGYYPGDIFVDANGNPNPFLPDGNGTDGFHNVVNGANGFEYVIAFDNYDRSNHTGGIGGGAYKIYKLDANSVLTSVKLEVNETSNAWRYKSGGTLLGSGTASYTSGANDATASTFLAGIGTPVSEQRSLLGGTHNLLSVNVLAILADITASGATFGAHFTMGCGNDEIVGWLPPSGTNVPDGGATVAMLGAAMLGAFGIRRKLS